MASSVPWISSTGQRMASICATRSSRDGAHGGDSTVAINASGLVSIAQPVASSMALVECGSGKTVRQKKSTNFG
jgi:hypothetical protein